MVCKLSFKILLAESYLLCISQPNELKRRIKKETGGQTGAKEKSGGAVAHPGFPLESPLHNPETVESCQLVTRTKILCFLKLQSLANNFH